MVDKMLKKFICNQQVSGVFQNSGCQLDFVFNQIVAVAFIFVPFKISEILDRNSVSSTESVLHLNRDTC